MQDSERSTLTAAESAGVLSSVPFSRATPNTVGFAHRESVLAALREHGTRLANLPRPCLTPVAGAAAFIVG